MAKVPLESTVLKTIEYDGVTRLLTVELQSGRVYRYADVPTSLYAQLLTAQSAGQFYNAQIKGKYQAPSAHEAPQEDVSWARRLLAE